MKERVKFLLEWERQWQASEGRVLMAPLCRAFGVSRPTGYLWVSRYEEVGHDLKAALERSKRPHSSPHTIASKVAERVVAIRRRFPQWGPKKLRAWLISYQPKETWPAASTIGRILNAAHLTKPRKKRRVKVPPYTLPFAKCTMPNMTWCVDFKGQFRTQDKATVYPLTIMDTYSRYLIRCSIVHNPNGIEVMRVFRSAFREFGLPAVIRTDNGPPFASKAPGGLSDLSAWTIRLGIVPERIEPGKPQQNGRHERMHRTLKLHTASPPQSSPRAQQIAFDKFLIEYNHERPHEALDMRTPSMLYAPSATRMGVETSPKPRFNGWTAIVHDNGYVRMPYKEKIFISPVLAGLQLEFVETSRTRCDVFFGPVLLGAIDFNDATRGLIRVNRKTRAGASPSAPPGKFEILVRGARGAEV